MNRIAIVTPTVPKRKQWVELQDLYYRGCSIPRYYACDESRNAFDAIREILPKVDAQYIVFAGDDDFHITERLWGLADGLDIRQDLAGAYGEGLSVQCDNLQVGWTADYSAGMRVERAFSLTRANVFRRAMALVPSISETGLHIMNVQNFHFINAMDAQGDFKSCQGLQLIHCNHSEHKRTPEPAWRTLAEKYGAGWLASWLPSRSCSRRSLERPSSPHHDEFMKFKAVLAEYRESLTPQHHPV